MPETSKLLLTRDNYSENQYDKSAYRINRGNGFGMLSVVCPRPVYMYIHEMVSNCLSVPHRQSYSETISASLDLDNPTESASSC